MAIICRPSPGFVLPPKLAAALAAHCKATGETPLDVIADALALHLDGLCDVEVDALDDFGAGAIVDVVLPLEVPL